MENGNKKWTAIGIVIIGVLLINHVYNSPCDISKISHKAEVFGQEIENSVSLPDTMAKTMCIFSNATLLIIFILGLALIWGGISKFIKEV